MPKAITVIMPVKNGEAFIAEAIESIALQSVSDLELFIVDDASTDNSVPLACEAANQFSIAYKLLNTPSLGPAAARNAGLQVAQSEFITFLDCDDLWPKSRLQMHLRHMLADTDCQALIGKTQFFCSQSADIDSLRFKNSSRSLFNANLGAATFRRSLFGKIGLLDPGLYYGEDQDFFLRLRESAHKTHYLDYDALQYRIHDDNMTKDLSAKQLNMFAVLRSSLKRRHGKKIPKLG